MATKTINFDANEINNRLAQMKVQDHATTESDAADLDLSDENGYVLLRIVNGHLQTKNFNSSTIPSISTKVASIEQQLSDSGIQIDSSLGTLVSSVRKQSSTAFDSTGVATIFEATGEGQIENMFFAGDSTNWNNPEQCTLNVYCDDVFCVSGKLYELACMNLDYAQKSDYSAMYIETPLFTKLGKQNSINLDFKIPYYSKCKVELVQPTAGVTDMIWTTVRARNKVNISYGGIKLPDGAYFKCVRKSNETISAGEQYTLMESSKNTMIIGCNLFVNATNTYSLEGCLRAFKTSDNSFQYLSSGLEDFFLGTYYFDSGTYQRQKAGLTYFTTSDGCKLSAYRLFVDNPICFDYPTKITVRNGDNIVNSDTDTISDTLVWAAGDATYGSFCFYYEW